MSVVPKKLPVMEKSDKKVPIVMWLVNSEIISILLYDGDISLSEAKKMDGQICFECNDFRSKEIKYSLNRLYKGIIVYSKNNVMKYIETNKGIMYF